MDLVSSWGFSPLLLLNQAVHVKTLLCFERGDNAPAQQTSSTRVGSARLDPDAGRCWGISRHLLTRGANSGFPSHFEGSSSENSTNNIKNSGCEA